jgi:hypothetical protein
LWSFLIPRNNIFYISLLKATFTPYHSGAKSGYRIQNVQLSEAAWAKQQISVEIIPLKISENVRTGVATESYPAGTSVNVA